MTWVFRGGGDRLGEVFLTKDMGKEEKGGEEDVLPALPIFVLACLPSSHPTRFFFVVLWFETASEGVTDLAECAGDDRKGNYMEKKQ